MSRRLLSEFLSVRTGGEADIEVITDASKLSRYKSELILGRGTNVLASDGGVTDKVIVMRNSYVTVNGDCLTAGGGTPLSLLASIAAKRGLSGLEWACGIPGSVGGGIVMNAGAYGGALGDVVRRVDVVTTDGRVRILRGDLRFGYRHTDGLPRGIIVEAELKCTESDERTVRERMAEFTAKRMATQPSGRTFGSTFARVGDKSAGWYIERVGLKGYKVGGARISEKHANFIINEGGAVSMDVRRLIDIAKLTVYDRFGVKLNEEVKYFGEF